MRQQKIGKGAFTTAYKRNDGKVLLKSCDPIKECMAHGWFPRSHLFPKISFGNAEGEYIMRYYSRPKSLVNTLKPPHLELYRQLRDVQNNYGSWYVYWNPDRRYHGFKAAVNHYVSNKRWRTHLIDAYEACQNYDPQGICFEISPRNVVVSDTNGLVLLDCFFSIEHLRKVKSTAGRST